jgi:membrane protease YdiL (CAAX protease family)
VALAALVSIVAGFALRPLNQRTKGTVWAFVVGESVLLLSAFVPAWVMGRVEGHTLGDYGLPARKAFGGSFWVGAVWGFAWLTFLLAAMHGLHLFDFGGLALHGPRIFKFAAFYAAFFLMVALTEEFLLRGYAQFTLTRGMGFWPAAVLLSLLFGAIHLGNSGEAWIGALAAACIGLFFCLTLRRTGSLWFAVGFHASWDWGESFFYSVPDSGQISPGHLLTSTFHGSSWLTGGPVGPEGSVLVYVLIVAMWMVFDRTYRQVKYPEGQ